MMSRNWLWKSLALCALASWAHAQTASTASKVPKQRLEATLGEGCRFTVTLPGKKGAQSPIDSSRTEVGGDPITHKGGMVASPQPAPWRSSMTALGFGIHCDDKDDPDAPNVSTDYTGATYDKSRKIWMKDLDKWFLPPAVQGDERIVRDKATRVVNIQAKNSKGFAQLTDDTTGEEDFRLKKMNFCLFHPPKAICGYGTVAMLRDGPKGDLTKYALEILKSIEFLDDVPGTTPIPSK
jgi:hypothetical protein